MRESRACPWSPGFIRAAAARGVRNLRIIASSGGGGRFGDRGDIRKLTIPHRRPGQRALHGAGRDGGAVDCGMLLLARIFRLGFLADFLSRTVVTGFLTGVGCSGRYRDARRHARRRGEFAQFARSIVADPQRLPPRLNVPTLVLSSIVAGGILVGKRFAPRLPLSLVRRHRRHRGERTRITSARAASPSSARSPAGCRRFACPTVTWSEVLALLPVSASCFVMIIAQSAATSRGFAVRYHESVDANADILGLSAANAAAGAERRVRGQWQSDPNRDGGSRGRTQPDRTTGAGGRGMLVLLVLSGPLQYLPRCVFAAIVFTIAVGMIDVRMPARHPPRKPRRVLSRHRHRGDGRRDRRRARNLAGDCAVAVPARTSQLPAAYHDASPDADRTMDPDPATPGKVTEPGLIVYRFGADLFYANQRASATRCAGWWRTRPARCVSSSSKRRRSPISTTRPRARCASSSRICSARVCA